MKNEGISAALTAKGRFGRTALFLRLGGQFQRPERDAWFYDEHQWHADLNEVTGYGLTCDTAILDWCQRASLQTKQTTTAQPCAT